MKYWETLVFHNSQAHPLSEIVWCWKKYRTYYKVITVGTIKRCFVISSLKTGLLLHTWTEGTSVFVNLSRSSGWSHWWQGESSLSHEKEKSVMYNWLLVWFRSLYEKRAPHLPHWASTRKQMWHLTIPQLLSITLLTNRYTYAICMICEIVKRPAG